MKHLCLEDDETVFSNCFRKWYLEKGLAAVKKELCQGQLLGCVLTRLSC